MVPPKSALYERRVHINIDPEVLTDQLYGARYHRLLLPYAPLTEDFAASVVTNLMHGVRT